MAIIALFSAILGIVFWLDSFEVFEPAFKYLPPVIWAYFVPMLCTTVGLTPAETCCPSRFSSSWSRST
jgi:uncharacterized membrane protein